MPRNTDLPHWGRFGERRIAYASPEQLNKSHALLRIKHYSASPMPLPVVVDIP